MVKVPPRISVCMHAMNRAWQVRQTLPRNIAACRGRAELVLVNYGSTDDLDAWVRAEHRADVESGALVYFHTPEPERFHASKSKNLAHRLATGDILLNCDGDNFITPADLDAVGAALVRHPAAIVRQFSGKLSDGTFGRIALQRGHYWMLGGYDEGLLPMSGQDDDLILRALMMGLEWIELGAPELPPVENSKQDKVPAGLAGAWSDMRAANLTYMEARQKIMGYRRECQFASWSGTLNFTQGAVIGPGHGAPVPAVRALPPPAVHPAEQPLRFNKAQKALERLRSPDGLHKALAALARGWGGARPADPVVLEQVYRGARGAKHGVLVCGADLACVVAACAAQVPVVALEHDGTRHRDMLYVQRRYRLKGLEVVHAPLALRDDGEWYGYRPTPERKFDLVVCEAGTAGLPGGRHGLLPAWVDALSVPSTVVLAGATRAECRELAHRWQALRQVRGHLIAGGDGGAGAGAVLKLS